MQDILLRRYATVRRGARNNYLDLKQTSWTNIFSTALVHQDTIVVNKLLILLRTVGGRFVNQRCLVRYLAACSLRLYAKFVNGPDGAL